MANEVRVNSNLTIRKIAADGTVLLDVVSRPSSFRASMTGAKGPVPGAIQAKLAANGGTQVDLSQLTRPTFCVITNLGPSNGDEPTDADFFEVGIWNAQDTSFSPLLEVGPGEAYTIKLTRNLQEIYQGPGSGTSGAGTTAKLMLLAYNKAQNAKVEAYEY